VRVAEDLNRYPCPDPEEGVKQAAAAAIKAAVEAQDSNSVVKVSASGHQNTLYGVNGAPDKIQNTLSITIEPLYGFVE
jgi:hypothetical protein